LFHIQDPDGRDLVTFKPVRASNYIIFSSPDLINGSSYSIYTGGASTGINTDGIYTGGAYSGGILKKSFIVSEKLSKVSF
jgi:hypothetical protein